MADFSSIIPAAVLTALVESVRWVPAGLIVEVGVYRGGSARLLYAERPADLHLFDTFTGIPFTGAHDRHQPGEFSDGVSLEALKLAMPLAHFYPGIFPATLPDDLRDIAFAHIDCDQYQSITDCIVHLWPRIVMGGIMWFDDYSALPGAAMAVLEHFSEAELRMAPEGRCYVMR